MPILIAATRTARLAVARLLIVLVPVLGPFAALVLIGCQGVSPSTGLALRTTDPLAITGTDLAAILVHSRTIVFADGDATLTLVAEDPMVGLSLREDFVLSVDDATASQTVLAPAASAVTQFALAEEDQAGFDRVIGAVRKIRDERRASGADAKRTGTFSISVSGRPCVADSRPAEIEADVYLRMKKDGRFRAIQKGADITGGHTLAACAADEAASPAPA